MTTSVTPRVSKKASQFTQYTYDLPHRAHCSKLYPLPLHPIRGDKSTAAPNILVYGHELGVTVVWNGFKVLKRKRKRALSDAGSDERDGIARDVKRLRKPERRRLHDSIDGNPSEPVMSLQDVPTRDEAATPQSSAIPEEQQEILSHLRNVHLGTAVYDISFAPPSLLPGTPLASVIEGWGYEADDIDEATPVSTMLLKRNLVLAVACSDNSVRLLSLPLDPSSSVSPSILTLAGISGHRTPPTTVSLSLVPAAAPPTKLVDRGVRAKSNSFTANEHLAIPSYDFLIASASSDVSGLLLLWRITPEKADEQIKLVAHRGPRTITLSSPPTHVRFNPSSSSSLHRHNLLVADSKGSFRILDTDKGRWLVSFYTDYPPHSQTRKRILDLNWCLDGQGIVTLTDDGEWGIWELLTKGRYMTCGKVGEILDQEAPNNASKRFGLGSATTVASRASIGGGSTASSSTAEGAGLRDNYSVATSSSTITSLRQSPSAHRRSDISKGSLSIINLPASWETRLFSSIVPKNFPGDHEMLVVCFENQVVLVPSLQETLSVKRKQQTSLTGVPEKVRSIELKDIVLGGEDIQSISIAWFVGRSFERALLGEGPRQQDNDDEEEEEEDDDYDLRNSILSRSFRTPPRPRGNSTPRKQDDSPNTETATVEEDGELDDEESKIPSLKITLATGARVSRLDVEDEVLSTEIVRSMRKDDKSSSGGLLVPLHRRIGIFPGLTVSPVSVATFIK